MRKKKKKMQRIALSAMQCGKQNSERQDTEMGCYLHRKIGCMGMGVYP